MKGQRPLAFFFALVPAVAGAQLSLEVDALHVGGQGLLSVRQWDGEQTRSPPTATWNHAAVRAGAHWQAEHWSIAAHKTRQAYFKGDTNLLILAAEDERKGQIDASRLPDVNVRGRVQTLDASVLSLSGHWQAQPWMRVTATPQVFQIHDYQRSHADFAWRSSTTPNELSGQLRRVGTRVYGFDANNRPDAGWGWGLGLQGELDLAHAQVTARATHLLGQLRFSNVHYTDRNYRVLATNGKVITQDAPSLSGQYGQFRRNERLPVFWQAQAKPKALPGLSAGLIGLDQESSVQAEYMWTLPRSTLAVGTIGFRNTSLGWTWSPSPRLAIGLGITAYKLRAPEASALSVRVGF